MNQKISWKRIFMIMLLQKGINPTVTHPQSYRITITWLMCILPILCLKARLKWLRNKIGWWVLVIKGGRASTLLCINIVHPKFYNFNQGNLLKDITVVQSTVLGFVRYTTEQLSILLNKLPKDKYAQKQDFSHYAGCYGDQQKHFFRVNSLSGLYDMP